MSKEMMNTSSRYVSILPTFVGYGSADMIWVLEDLRGQILVGGLYEFAYKHEYKLTII